MQLQYSVQRNTICIWFCWFACFMAYFGLIYNTPAFDWNIYLVFIFPGLLGIPKALLMPFIGKLNFCFKISPLEGHHIKVS